MSPLLAASASAIDLKDIRAADKAEGMRLVLDFSRAVEGWRIFLLDEPRRAVIDITGVKEAVDKDAVSSEHLSGLRYGRFNRGVFRIVLDLASPLKVEKAFVLPPGGRYPHRLVVDLVKTDAADFARAVKAPPLARNFTLQREQKISPPPLRAKPAEQKKPMIVIDPGHGGVDPGARGRKYKTKEKLVTLKAAQILRKELLKGGKYRVVLTRNSDVYVPLRKRVEIARKAKGDLFISLHADSLPGSKTARGLSVYTLSERASDKEAAALAKRENKADIIAGLDFSDQPKEITNILIDLTQRETMNYSITFSELLMRQMRGKVRLLKRTHRHAGFVVLKSPEVPSVLIELGYLSDPAEEKSLRSDSHLKNLAALIAEGVHAYFKLKEKTA